MSALVPQHVHLIHQTYFTELTVLVLTCRTRDVLSTQLALFVFCIASLLKQRVICFLNSEDCRADFNNILDSQHPPLALISLCAQSQPRSNWIRRSLLVGGAFVLEVEFAIYVQNLSMMVRHLWVISHWKTIALVSSNRETWTIHRHFLLSSWSFKDLELTRHLGWDQLSDSELAESHLEHESILELHSISQHHKGACCASHISYVEVRIEVANLAMFARHIALRYHYFIRGRVSSKCGTIHAHKKCVV